jgi:cell division protein FtsZ
MSAIDLGIDFQMPKNQSSQIKVMGIGGGGSNAVNYMFEHGIKGVDFVICNTDAQALEASPVPIKIQLGANLTEGLGAGSNPDVGRRAAEESADRITELLDANTKMLFITAGMGGGTGTGAAPVIAEIAQEKGILTVGVVTVTFATEGGYRRQYADEGIIELKKYVDTLLVIDNES